MSAPFNIKPPRVIPIAPHLVTLIESCCFPGTGYRAPRNPSISWDEAQEVVIHENAMALHFSDVRADEYLRNRDKYLRRKREREQERRAQGFPRVRVNERRKNIAPAIVEEVFELVRIHGPISTHEATVRMMRAGFTRDITVGALVNLSDNGKIKGTVVPERKGQPPMLVYEVAA